jgi:hypothetical protein
VLIWAVDTHRPFDHVVAILRTLDVNGRGLRRFPWLSRTTPAAAREAEPQGMHTSVT